MKPVLRDYQHQARDALHKAYARGLHRVGVQLATGCGKTVIIGDISDKVIASAKTSRVNILLHRDTLVDQTIRKLLTAGIDPDEIGVVKANRNEIHKRCLVVSIHSLRNTERMKQLPRPQLTIVDEAHVSVSMTGWALMPTWRASQPRGCAQTARG